MKIGIVGAMAQEVEILSGLMTDKTETRVASAVILEGKINGKAVALLQSGIGKVAAAIGTAALLQLTKPDAVLNTGSAGGVARGLKVGDIVISDETRYHDVDVTAFGYEKGQLPANPAAFLSDKKLADLAEKVAQEQGQSVKRGLICSGDSFINSEQKIAQIKADFPNVTAVEMEATAIAQVCHAFNVPFVVVRAISDAGDGEASLSFEEFLPLAAKQSSRILRKAHCLGNALFFRRRCACVNLLLDCRNSTALKPRSMRCYFDTSVLFDKCGNCFVFGLQNLFWRLFL